jgi:positive regulator of sigma E activity
MDNPTGTIQSVVAENDGVRAIVSVDVAIACPRCAAGKGCGAGLFSGNGRTHTVEAVANQHMALGKGDFVELRLAPNNVLAASAIVYGIPLAGAIAAAGAAYFMQFGDSAAAVAAVSGLVAGLMISRWQLNRAGCIDKFVPHIEKRLQNADH